MEILKDWKKVKIGQVQHKNRLRGRTLSTGTIENVDDSPHFLLLNVGYKMDKYGIKYMADIVYSESKKTAKKQFKTLRPRQIFVDHSAEISRYVEYKIAEEKAVNDLANETWQTWVEEQRIAKHIADTTPQRLAEQKKKRLAKKAAREKKLDEQLARMFS